MDREMKRGTEGRIAFMGKGILYFLEGRNQVILICAAQGRCGHTETSKHTHFPWKNYYDGGGGKFSLQVRSRPASQWDEQLEEVFVPWEGKSNSIRSCRKDLMTSSFLLSTAKMWKQPSETIQPNPFILQMGTLRLKRWRVTCWSHTEELVARVLTPSPEAETQGCAK